jgi:hypothetical protein
MPRPKMPNPVHYVTIVHLLGDESECKVIHVNYKMSFMAAQRVMSKRIQREFPLCTHFDFYEHDNPNESVTQFRRNVTASTTILNPQENVPIRCVRSNEKAPV